MFKVLAVIEDISLSIHDEFKMYKPLSRKPVPLNISCPRRALDVHQDLKWILLVFARCFSIKCSSPLALDSSTEPSQWDSGSLFGFCTGKSIPGIL